MTQITTAGRSDEMLNILVNDSSFSTLNGEAVSAVRKKGKGSSKRKGKKNKMGFSAQEILKMKKKEKRSETKPKIRPVVYFRDFEKRFDSIIGEYKTPR